MNMKSKFARGIRVTPRSKAELLAFAHVIRAAFHLENTPYFPVVQFLESLSVMFDDFNYEIVEPGVLPKREFACFNPFNGMISICETYYKMANEGNGFARWTILHECLHFLLHRNQLGALARQDNSPHKIYEDSEWQVNVVVCELLMPSNMISKDMTVEEVAEKFGVSKAAASNRLKNL